MLEMKFVMTAILYLGTDVQAIAEKLKLAGIA